MLTRLFTGRIAALRRVEHLEDQVLALSAQVKRLESELDGTQDQLARLRGRFYATRVAPGETPAAPQVPDSREARRKAAFEKAGVLPGRPVDLRTIERKDAN